MLNASLNAQHFLAQIGRYRSINQHPCGAAGGAVQRGDRARDPPRRVFTARAGEPRRARTSASPDGRDGEALAGRTDSTRSAMPEPLTDDAVSALMPELRAVMREAADIARPFFRLGGQTLGPDLVEVRRLAGDRGGRRGRRLPEGAPERPRAPGGVAVGGDCRRPGPPRPRPRLDRRSDRRDAGLPVGPSGLVDSGGAPVARRAADRLRPRAGGRRGLRGRARARRDAERRTDPASIPGRACRAPASPARSRCSTVWPGAPEKTRTSRWSRGSRPSPCGSPAWRTARSISG